MKSRYGARVRYDSLSGGMPDGAWHLVEAPKDHHVPVHGSADKEKSRKRIGPANLLGQGLPGQGRGRCKLV